MGLLNNLVPFSLIFWGQTHIAVGVASILNATTPLFTVVVAHFMTSDERLTGAKTVALLAGLAGVILLVGPDLLVQSGASIWGELACLAAALSYAFAGIYGRRFKSLGVGPMEAATGHGRFQRFLRCRYGAHWSPSRFCRRHWRMCFISEFLQLRVPPTCCWSPS